MGESGYQEHDAEWSTSSASPVVAGAVALLLGEDPNLTNEDCQEILDRSAQRIGAPIEVGAGLPRLDEAVSWLQSSALVSRS